MKIRTSGYDVPSEKFGFTVSRSKKTPEKVVIHEIGSDPDLSAETIENGATMMVTHFPREESLKHQDINEYTRMYYEDKALHVCGSHDDPINLDNIAGKGTLIKLLH